LELQIDEGEFNDIYDFNYKKGGISRRGATVQAGFPTLLGYSGKVFKLHVRFDGATTW